MNQQAAATSKTPAYAWVVLFAIYMASLAAPLNQSKVPPVMPILRETFDMSHFAAGTLMSIFSIMGFILAIPAGFILRRFGIKLTGLAAVGAVMIGAGIGALSNTAGLLFFGRFVEGSGMGLIMVAAPAAISLWFPAEKRGLPMGLWASCVGVATIAALNLAPLLEASYGWRSVWWVGAGFAVVAFVLFGLLFRLPRQEEMIEAPQQDASESDKPLSLTKAMANRNLWLISITFMCFNLVLMALISFYPDYLNTVRQLSLANASFMTSLMMIIAIITGPLGGYLSDRTGSRKSFIVAPFILLGLVFLFPFSAIGWMIPALMIVTGIAGGPIAPVSLAAVPEIMVKPQLAAIGLGVAALGQNVGMAIGPTMFGWLVETTGWATAGYMMIPICALAVICACLAKIR